MLRRYPWESTTLSTPLSSIIASTTRTTITTPSTYKRVTIPGVTTLSKYTQTTINNLYTDRYKTKYSSNINSNNNNNNSGIGGISTTTRRSVTNFFNSYYTVSTTPKVTNGPKINPFKYKSVMSLSTTTKGYQNGLRNDGRGKRILN